jgi:hypothetical protein
VMRPPPSIAVPTFIAEGLRGLGSHMACALASKIRCILQESALRPRRERNENLGVGAAAKAHRRTGWRHQAGGGTLRSEISSKL